MNGYTLANQFRKLRPSFSFSSLEADLFYELVALCNDRGWPTEFQYPNYLLCATLHPMVESTLVRARNRLKQVGLLEFTSGHKRNPTVHRLLDPDAAQIPLPETSKSAGTNGGISEGESGGCIYKEKTKRKTNPSAAAESEDFPFEEFWQAYGKKEDKHKCAQRWAALTPAERQAALTHLPGYVAPPPDKKYRKESAALPQRQVLAGRGTAHHPQQPTACASTRPGFVYNPLEGGGWIASVPQTTQVLPLATAC